MFHEELLGISQGDSMADASDLAGYGELPVRDAAPGTSLETEADAPAVADAVMPADPFLYAALAAAAQQGAAMDDIYRQLVNPDEEQTAVGPSAMLADGSASGPQVTRSSASRRTARPLVSQTTVIIITPAPLITNTTTGNTTLANITSSDATTSNITSSLSNGTGAGSNTTLGIDDSISGIIEQMDLALQQLLDDTFSLVGIPGGAIQLQEEEISTSMPHVRPPPPSTPMPAATMPQSRLQQLGA